MTIQQEEQAIETWKYELGKALKSLGLGMSGSQADFIFEHVQHLMDIAYKQGKGDVASQRKQVIEEIKEQAKDCKRKSCADGKSMWEAFIGFLEKFY
jgi:hypothetical protein